MLCPNCGSELTPGAKFCITCGATVEAAVPAAAPVESPVAPVEPVFEVEQPAVPAEPAEAPKKEGVKIDVNAVKEQLVETLKPVTNFLKPIFAKKIVRYGVLGGFALLIVLGIVFGLIFSGNGYTLEKQITSVIQVDDELEIVVNGKLTKSTIKLDYRRDEDGEPITNEEGKKEYCSYSTRSSMDGKVTAVWVYDTVYGDNAWYGYDCGTLYVINGKKVQKVAEDVTSYKISVSGKGVAYTTKNEKDEDDELTTYTLNLYNVGNKKTTKISKKAANSNYELAPNGKSVAYYEGKVNDEGGIEYSLYYSNGKNSEKITSKETTLMGLSNNGKYIYAIRTDRNETDEGTEVVKSVYCFNKKGDGDKLGKIDNTYSYYFNEAHTQVMFYNEGKTYIATKNKEAQRASSKELSMIAPDNAAYFGNTYPVSDLYNHMYVDTEVETITKNDTEINVYSYDVWMIKKNADKNQKLVNNASTYPRLDNSAEYLYYLDDSSDLYCAKVSHGESAGDKATKIAEEVDNYQVSPDRKYVYFESDDTLYSVNGKKGGKATTICNDDVSQYDVSAKGILYYITEGELYASSNGKKGKKLLSDIQDVICTPNGITFAGDDDTLYVSTGAKKLKKLLDLK